MVDDASGAVSGPPLSLAAAYLLGLGCSVWLWDRLAARWRSVHGRMAAGAIAALPLFLMLRLSVVAIRGWGITGFLRAGATGLVLGAFAGWYAARNQPP